MRKQSTYRPGDIAAFRVPKGEVGAGQVVIHRVEGGDQRGYVMLGDNKDAEDPWTPAVSDMVRKRVVLIPRFGRIVAVLAQPVALGVIAGLLAALVVATTGDRNQGDRARRAHAAPARAGHSPTQGPAPSTPSTSRRPTLRRPDHAEPGDADG